MTNEVREKRLMEVGERRAQEGGGELMQGDETGRGQLGLSEVRLQKVDCSKPEGEKSVKRKE
jgi:hypothetical protein